MLHAKVILIDDILYAGSANLDSRSFNINYELLIRLADPVLAAEGREIFARDLLHCRRIDFKSWIKSKSFWDRLKIRLSCYLLSRIDPLIARYQWRNLIARARRVRRTLR